MGIEDEIRVKRNELIEEYKFLRTEIIFMLQKESDYTKFIFTFIIAAITLSYKMEESIGYFVALIMSVIFQVQVLVIRETIVKIGAYIYVFLEPEINIKWETRNFNPTNPNDTIIRRIKDSPRHLFWSFIHSILFFLYISQGSLLLGDVKNSLSNIGGLELIIIAIWVYSFFLTYKGYTTREIKIKYIDYYSKIKSKENFGKLEKK